MSAAPEIQLSLTGTVSGGIFTDLVNGVILGADTWAHIVSVLQYKNKARR